MPSILNLKFKGNKSFVAFSNLNDTEALTRTWKVCTKVAGYLEQGQRLENLSWRLWHLQNLMVDSDNARSKREFKKVAKNMGDKLDKEKGRSIHELEAPDFRPNQNTEAIRQRAVEKERLREANQNAKPGTIKRMQFTFPLDQPTPAVNTPVNKPDLKPSPEFTKRPRQAAPRNLSILTHDDNDDIMAVTDDSKTFAPLTLTQKGRKAESVTSDVENQQPALHFPSFFSSNDLYPVALYYPSPTLSKAMTYGEGLNPPASNDGFSVLRPTIELPIDDLLSGSESPPVTQDPLPYAFTSDMSTSPDFQPINNGHTVDMEMPFAQIAAINEAASTLDRQILSDENSSSESEESDTELMSTTTLGNVPPISDPMPFANSKNISSSVTPRKRTAPSNETPTPTPTPTSTKEFSTYITSSGRVTNGSRRPSLTVKTHLSPTSSSGRSSGLSASFTARLANSPRGRVVIKNTANTTTPTPPASLTNSAANNANGGTSSSSSTGSATPLPSVGSNTAPGGMKAECFNCGATHTPLWRRGLNDELNCNACGLYCKLHKRPRPKTMRNAHKDRDASSQSTPRPETIDVAQCYNCHTTATPLWRKDDEGKTVCNACGLYYKLHGTSRPISMKSDVIRKRSRHDAIRQGRSSANSGFGSGGSGSNSGPSETPSPEASRHNSPVRESSPTLAPDSTTQKIDYSDDSAVSEEPADMHDMHDLHGEQSELLNALGGQDAMDVSNYGYGGLFQFQYPPEPYPHDHFHQLLTPLGDALPFASSEIDSMDSGLVSPRLTKRRRMSTDSTSEPPSSAVSYSSYTTNTDGYMTTPSSATSHSQRSSISMEFGPACFPATFGNGSSTYFRFDTSVYHPPMKISSETSPMIAALNVSANTGPNSTAANGGFMLHPPMVPIEDDSSMDFLHPPMQLDYDKSVGNSAVNEHDVADEMYYSFVHPPMTLADESNGGTSGTSNSMSSYGDSVVMYGPHLEYEYMRF